MTPTDLQKRLAELAPETTVEVIDLTGTEDHYQAIVVSAAFEGKVTIQQHRLALAKVQAEIDSGELHALTLRTFSPAQYKKYLGEE